jgi:hypothetical protein
MYFDSKPLKEQSEGTLPRSGGFIRVPTEEFALEDLNEYALEHLLSLGVIFELEG